MKPLFIARQGRRPSGILGRVIARIMACETSAENDRALELLALRADDRLIELGCGHGATLAKAAHVITKGDLAGVDFSSVMIAEARRRNRRHVEAGRMSLHLGSSEDLPFTDEGFTAALSVHTIYFWQDPVAHLKEARRILVPGGRLLLGFRPAEDRHFVASYPGDVYTIRRTAEIVGLMKCCGFRHVFVRAAQFGNRQIIFASGLA